MKLKHLLYIAIFGASISACSNDSAIGNDAAEKVAVTINLSQSGLSDSVSSRATDQMPLEDCNLMYNLILLHYNSNQVLTEVKSITVDAKGLYETTWAPILETGTDDYLVLLANVKQDNDGLETIEKWNELKADRFANLRDVLTTDLPLTAGSNGSYDSDKKMFMMGYYQGKVTSGMNLNVMMGRMASCIKLVIAPTTGSATVSKVQIENAVMNTHFFPASSTDGLTYDSYTDNLSSNNTATTSAPLTLYYYTGENINPEYDQYTTATITVEKNAYTDVVYADEQPDGYTLADDVNDSNYYGYYRDWNWGKHRWYSQWYIAYADTKPQDNNNYVLSDDVNDRNYYGYSTNYDKNATDDAHYPTYSTYTWFKHRYTKAIPASSQTYKVVLGSDSPSVTTNRNYSLYRNNTYTFTLNLK